MENLEQPKWYALHTKSGSEPRVLRDMETKLNKYPEFKNYIVDLKMLVEDEIVEKDGKRKVVQRRKLPNYV